MSVAIQNEPAAPGKLIVAPTEAAQWVLAQLEKGHAIRKLKLRYAEDLEKAREKKGEWVKQTNDLLKGMFDTESIAQEFNTWEVRVLPEYAELSLFIDVFYEEMDQRLMRLTSVHRRIPAGPGSNGAPAPDFGASADFRRAGIEWRPCTHCDCCAADSRERVDRAAKCPADVFGAPNVQRYVHGWDAFARVIL